MGFFSFVPTLQFLFFLHPVLTFSSSTLPPPHLILFKFKDCLVCEDSKCAPAKKSREQKQCFKRKITQYSISKYICNSETERREIWYAVWYPDQRQSKNRIQGIRTIQDNTKTRLHLCWLPLSWVWFCSFSDDLFQYYSLNPLELSADMDINNPSFLFLSCPFSLLLFPSHCRDEKHAFLMKVGILISLCYSKSWCPNLSPIVHKC